MNQLNLLLLAVLIVNTNCRNIDYKNFLRSLLYDRNEIERQSRYRDDDYSRFSKRYSDNDEVENVDRYSADEGSVNKRLMNLLSDIETQLDRPKKLAEENLVDPTPVIKKHELKMPGVAPKKRDTYLCYAYELPNTDVFIKKFEPDADMKIAHHMLLFGCETPFQKNKVWNCREMQPVCGSGMQAIKYAWGKNAPSLEMPKNVAFHVGGQSTIKYLVLQVHYLNVEIFKDGKTRDKSGLDFTTTSEKPQYYAGIHLLGAGWPPIPSHKEKFHIDMNCLYKNENGMKLYPFRFRTHAHKLGSVITAYRVRNGKATIIGRGDPQRAQAFYKVNEDLAIQNNDLLIGRCTYNSTTRDKITYIGATHSDEMCNFYIMYFYDSKYGDVNQLPCYGVDNKYVQYPADSDVTLAEVEKKNSIALHEQRLQNKIGESVQVCKDSDIFTYKVAEHWPVGGKTTGDLPGYLGQVAGVAATNRHVIIFHRVKRRWGVDSFDAHNVLNKKYQVPINGNTLLWLDRHTGKLVKASGKGMFYMPHGLTVDGLGNLWITDVGSHQIYKMTPDGKIVMTLGEKFVPGHDDEHFCKPTDVAVMKNGDFFVADGYCNSRVVKFNPKGEVLSKITPKTTESLSPNHMFVVHSLALDEKNGQLYVADRENRRILIFDTSTGDYKSQIVLDYPVYAIAYEKTCGGVIHAVTLNENNPEESMGYTFSVHSSTPVSEWAPGKGFHMPHDLAVSPDQRQLFVSEIAPNRIWKFTNGKVRP